MRWLSEGLPKTGISVYYCEALGAQPLNSGYTFLVKSISGAQKNCLTI